MNTHNNNNNNNNNNNRSNEEWGKSERRHDKKRRSSSFAKIVSAKAHLLVTSYFVGRNSPRRLPFNDHKPVPVVPVTPSFITTYRSTDPPSPIN